VPPRKKLNVLGLEVPFLRSTIGILIIPLGWFMMHFLNGYEKRLSDLEASDALQRKYTYRLKSALEKHNITVPSLNDLKKEKDAEK
jgi:hypothetical protein